MEILRAELPFARSSSPEPPVLTQEFIAYSDTRIMCTVKREHYKTNRDFFFDDHLYRMTFEAVHPTDSHFTVESSLYAIEKSVEEVLSILQDYYVKRSQGTDPNSELGKVRREHSHQCFIVVSSGGFNSQTFKKKNIVIGSFDVEETSPLVVANYLCSKLKRVLNQYNDSIYLDDEFLVRFRCIGGPLVKRNVEERKFQKNKEKVNLDSHEMQTFDFPEGLKGEECGKKKATRHLWSAPSGFIGSEDCFKDKCLFTSLAVARAISQVQKYKTIGRPKPPKKVFLLVTYFHSRKKKLPKKVGLYLKEQVEWLEKNCGNASSVQDVFRSVAKVWNMQLVIYDKEANLVGLFPNEISLKCTLSFFLLTKNSTSTGHIEIIANFPQWVRQYGFACFLPGCNFKSRYFVRRGHMCQAKVKELSSCFTCRKYKLSPDSLATLPLDKENKDFFFCRRVNFEQPLKCEKCNLIASSESCFIAHKKICEHIGYMCPTCNNYLHGMRKMLKETHVCGTITCQMCYQLIPQGQTRSEHLCSWARPRGTSEMRNIAIANIVLPPGTSSTCLECFELEKKSQVKCSFHKLEDVELSPPVCTLIFEEEVHENWSAACFVNDFLPDVKLSPPPLGPYIPDRIRDLLTAFGLSKERLPKRFNSAPKKSQTLEEDIARLNQKVHASSVDKFLAFILTEKFRNFTIFFASFEELQYAMTGLIDNCIMPISVRHNEGKTMKFSLPYFNVKLQCFRTHVDLDLWELAGAEDEISFFPRSILLSNNWQDLREIPPLHCFFQLDDHDSLRELKKSFWEGRREKPWNSATQLVESSTSAATVLAKVVVEYLGLQMEYQVKSHYYKHIPNKHNPVQA